MFWIIHRRDADATWFGMTSSPSAFLLLQFLKLGPRVPGTLPVLFRRPSLGLQQMEISWWLSVHGKMSDGGEGVVDQAPIHLLAIESVGRQKIVCVAVN